MSSPKKIIEGDPRVFWFIAVIGSFAAGVGAVATYRDFSNQVVLSQEEYLRVTSPPEVLEFSATNPPELTLPKSKHPSAILVQATCSIVAEHQGKHAISIFVGDERVATVNGYRSNHDKEDRISLKLSGSRLLAADQECRVAVVVEKDDPSPVDTNSARYTLNVTRKYDYSEDL